MRGTGLTGRVLALGLAICVASVTRGQGAEGPRAPDVDLALVLAVDASGSVDRGELAVQRDGYVAALRHPDFARAIRAGRRGRIAVTYFEWSGRPIAGAAAPWTVIDGPEAAAALAAEIADLPRRGGYGTSISRALDLGLALIDAAPVAAARRVIDVSGDGPNNIGPPLVEAQGRALARGVTINGLPLVLRPARGAADIVRYYEDCVIGGDGAFVVAALGPAEVAGAIRRKLILEIGDGGAARDGKVWRSADAATIPCEASNGVAPFYPWLYDW